VAFCEGWPRRDTRSIWEWADNRVGMDRTRRRGEKWHLARTPWVKQILEDWQDPEVRELVLCAAAGAAKTTPMQVVVAWQVAIDPCPIAWITCNEVLANDAATERVTPMLENTPDTAAMMLPGYRDKTLRKVRTKYCTIDIGAATQQSTFEQRRYRVFIGDECRKWDAGALSKAQNRQIGYEDAKRAFCSTAGLSGDEFDQHYMAGNKAEWFFPCMGCGQLITFVWSKEHTRLPEPYSKLAEVVYDEKEMWLRCVGCNHSHRETAAVKRHILETGRWHDLVPDAARRIRSYHWTIFIAPWSQWNAEILPKWKLAVESLKVGNAEQIKEFVQETLAEAWEEGQEVEKRKLTMASYTVEQAGSDWPFVFMTVDVGKYDFWHVVRGWKPGAQSRLLSGGQLRYWADVEHVAAKFGLVLTGRSEEGLAEGLCRRVFIDARYEDPVFQEVHRKAAEMGWTCFIDTDKPYFEVLDEDNEDKVKLRFLYSEPRFYDSKTGVSGTADIKGVEFSIANPTAQDVLDELLTGKVGKFESPTDFTDGPVTFKRDLYALHLRNQPKLTRINKLTGHVEYYRKRIGPQHLRACEWQQVVAASMPKLIADLPVDKENL